MCLQVDPDDRPGFGEIAAYLGTIKSLLNVEFSNEEKV